jgi:hypothetical protein
MPYEYSVVLYVHTVGMSEPLTFLVVVSIKLPTQFAIPAPLDPGAPFIPDVPDEPLDPDVPELPLDPEDPEVPDEPELPSPPLAPAKFICQLE